MADTIEWYEKFQTMHTSWELNSILWMFCPHNAHRSWFITNAINLSPRNMTPEQQRLCSLPAIYAKTNNHFMNFTSIPSVIWVDWFPCFGFVLWIEFRLVLLVLCFFLLATGFYYHFDIILIKYFKCIRTITSTVSIHFTFRTLAFPPNEFRFTNERLNHAQTGSRLKQTPAIWQRSLLNYSKPNMVGISSVVWLSLEFCLCKFTNGKPLFTFSMFVCRPIHLSKTKYALHWLSNEYIDEMNGLFFFLVAFCFVTVSLVQQLFIRNMLHSTSNMFLWRDFFSLT